MKASRTLLVAILAGAAVVGGSPSEANARAVTREGAAGMLVSRFTVMLVDTSRPTPANGSYPGAPSRSLETVVSYPTRAGRAVPGPLPLIVFAHGHDGTATNYAPLYDHWVQAGYVVAAPTFPLSRHNAPGGTTAADFPNQPGDVRFVTTELLTLNRTRSSRLHGLVDPGRVGLAGKSLGAITALEVGYSLAQRDPRFRAVISLTGIVGGPGMHFTGITTPLLLEHGDADTTVPIQGSSDAFTHAQPPKFFVTLFGQTHGSAFSGGMKPAELVVERTTLDFLDRYVKGQPTALARLQRDANIPGVASLQSAG